MLKSCVILYCFVILLVWICFKSISSGYITLAQVSKKSYFSHFCVGVNNKTELKRIASLFIPRHTIVGCPCVRPSVVRSSVFSFPDDNLSKCQWIFTKLGVSIDIMEIWYGIVNWQISSFLTVICLRHVRIFICR